jgi:hypothetical protein
MANTRATVNLFTGTGTTPPPDLDSTAHHRNLPEPIRDFIEYAIKPSSLYQTIPKYYNLGF